MNVDAKHWARPIGAETVRRVGEIGKSLREAGYIDKTVIVSLKGFTTESRRSAANLFAVELTEFAD